LGQGFESIFWGREDEKMNEIKATWSESINRRRDPESIQKLISWYSDLNLKTTDYGALKLVVGQIIDGWIKKEKGWKLNGFYRARRNEEQSFENISEIKAPLERHVKKYGRLNTPGQGTFYAAEKSVVALWEIRVREGDIVTLGHFMPTKEIEVSLLDLGVYESECAKLVGYKNLKNHDQELTDQLGESTKYSGLISDYVLQEMTKIVESGNEHEYKSTCAIAELLWRSNSKHPVVLYPSISRNLHGVNLALHPQFVEENYSITGIQQVEILKVGLKEIRYRTIKYSEWSTTSGNIMWKNGPNHEQSVTDE
jgi:hypothetical protein